MSKLLEMREKFPMTEIWMDSFHVDDHNYGITQGVTGVTTSPTWVSRMLLQEREEVHSAVVNRLKSKYPTLNEEEVLWAWTLEMGKERSKVMLPLWEVGTPLKGRYSIQTSIYRYNSTSEMISMALEVDSCGPNMQVKIPTTSAGINAMEEATYLGISVMATLCYSVDQAIAVARAIEKGLNRREMEGKDITNINPVCAVLLGMQDDWLRSYVDKENIVIHPDALNWPGVAICKKISKIYKERKYKTRILTAYYRHQLHWSEFIGGDLIMTIPARWQKRFEKCDLEIKNYFDVEVDNEVINQLNKLQPFVKAYNEHSLTIEEFDSFPPVTLTIHYFSEEYDKARIRIREMMLKKP